MNSALGSQVSLVEVLPVGRIRRVLFLLKIRHIHHYQTYVVPIVVAKNDTKKGIVAGNGSAYLQLLPR